MAEIILIDQLVQQPEEENTEYSSYYIRLAIEEASGVGFGMSVPKTLVVEESLHSGVIRCRVVIEDLAGSLVNIKPLEGDFTFNLYIGRSVESYQTYSLKLHDLRYDSMNPGESGNTLVELTLISSHWQPMIHDRRSKGWRNVRYSDVVREIVAECGIEDTVITDTMNTVPTIINPYWTNEELLRWIAERATPKSGHSFYTFSALPNNAFFFCSFEDLANGVTEGIFNNEQQDPREFILSGDGAKVERRLLMNFRVNMHYGRQLCAGASGVDYGYYDYNNRTYVRGTHRFSESQESQLSNWSLISESQETIGSFYDGGRRDGPPGEAMSRVSRASNKVHEVITSTRGTTDVQVGEKIDIMIPVSPEFVDIQFNAYFSGAYIVSSKKTICNLNNSTAETVFRLTRQGINGTDVNTLIQSQKGKR